MQPGLHELAHRSCLLIVKSVAPRQDARPRSLSQDPDACVYVHTHVDSENEMIVISGDARPCARGPAEVTHVLAPFSTRQDTDTFSASFPFTLADAGSPRPPVQRPRSLIPAWLLTFG